MNKILQQCRTCHKVMAFLAFFTMAMLLFGGLVWNTLDTVQVHGPHYHRVVQNKDLLADVLPPPNYIVESYLTAHLMLSADNAELDELVAHYEQLKRDYADRQQHWREALEEGRLKTEINEVSRKPAEAFFEIVDTELIPAVRDGDLETARSLLEGDLADNYGTHRESVDTIVATTVENAEATEAEVSGIIASRKGWMLAVGLVIMATIGACAIWLLSSASRDEESAHDWVAQLDGIRRTQAVVEFEPDGTILTANELFLKAMGYQLEDIVGRHHRIFMPEHLSNTPQYAEQWRTLARGEAVSGEFERRHKSGEAVWIQGAYYPILDRSGQVYKVVKFASEITDLVAVRKEANRIRSMVDQSSLSVVFATPDGRIDYANGAALECVRELEPLLGFRANDLIGKPLDSFASDPEGRRQLSIEESGLPRRFHLEVGCETLEVQLSAVTDDGEYVGAMMSWEAITERLNSERAAKQAADREKEKSQEFIQLLNKIRLNAETLSTSAEEMTQVSGQMTVNADETFTQANVVSAAAEQVSVNVRTVATGVEEMNSAIREIARNATESARVAERAVTDAQQANSTISKLGDSSSEIGKVIKVITSIAEQTNLLALNATIEAARAGEAGKGFAVVANEVKELAKETAKATEDISGKIETIQTDTTGAVESIRLIGEVIGQIHDISNAIAGAVEEQTATASEMTRNVSEAAKGTAEIAQNITSVANAAQHTSEGATNCQQAASELAQMSSELQNLGNGHAASSSVANSEGLGAADSWMAVAN